MKLYVIRNKEGKFFRPTGMNGGQHWHDDLSKAKFYPKIGTAKSQVTFYYRTGPQYGCPDILEFSLDASQAVVLNMQPETDKKIKNKEIKDVRNQLRYAEYALEEYRKKYNQQIIQDQERKVEKIKAKLLSLK